MMRPAFPVLQVIEWLDAHPTTAEKGGEQSQHGKDKLRGGPC